MTAAASNVVPLSAKTLGAALVIAQRYARGVEKDSKNQYHQYKYASAEAIIEEAREALSHAGIAASQTGWRVVESNDPAKCAKLIVDYLVEHDASGEKRTCTTETSIVPEKGRPQDKAEATALTYSLGYFLRGLLLLPRVEEGSQVDERRDSPATRPRKGPANDGPPRAQTEPTPANERAAQAATEAIEKATSYDQIVEIGKQIEASFKLGPLKAAVLSLAQARAEKMAEDPDA